MLPRPAGRGKTASGHYQYSSPPDPRGAVMARALCLALGLVLPGLTPGARLAADWPAFRGGGRAVPEAPALPSSWDVKTNVRWKADVPGAGWSSPVVAGGRVFV